MSNDRFKFRVWDSLEKKYLDAPAVWLSSDGYAHEVDCELSTIDYTIEQCTGLADKNGKLIFEGDVLNVEDYDGFRTMIVAWHDKASCLSLLKQKAGKYAPIWRHLVAFVSDELEIIGNIHDEQFREVTKMMEDEQC